MSFFQTMFKGGGVKDHNADDRVNAVKTQTMLTKGANQVQAKSFRTLQTDFCGQVGQVGNNCKSMRANWLHWCIIEEIISNTQIQIRN